MRTSIKDVGFAIFFLVVIAVVAVQAAEDHGETDRQEINEKRVPVAPDAPKP